MLNGSEDGVAASSSGVDSNDLLCGVIGENSGDVRASSSVACPEGYADELGRRELVPEVVDGK
jgi:hypothetical protein